MVRGPVKKGARVEPEALNDVELQLVGLVEVLQEPLINRVQVDDEEVAHGSIMAHLDEGNVLRAGRLCSGAE